jgi:hypothetical protein
VAVSTVARASASLKDVVAVTKPEARATASKPVIDGANLDRLSQVSRGRMKTSGVTIQRGLRDAGGRLLNTASQVPIESVVANNRAFRMRVSIGRDVDVDGGEVRRVPACPSGSASLPDVLRPTPGCGQ